MPNAARWQMPSVIDLQPNKPFERIFLYLVRQPTSIRTIKNWARFFKAISFEYQKIKKGYLSKLFS